MACTADAWTDAACWSILNVRWVSGAVGPIHTAPLLLLSLLVAAVQLQHLGKPRAGVVGQRGSAVVAAELEFGL